jgi:hypothetical protein
MGGNEVNANEKVHVAVDALLFFFQGLQRRVQRGT